VRALYPAPDGTVAEFVGVGRYKTRVFVESSG
jgi:hypothetical protein